MEKAFDTKALIGKFKARGIAAAEDTARGAVEDVFGWIEESVTLSDNKIDDAALAILPTIKKFVLEQVDKIDGKVEAAPEAPAG